MFRTALFGAASFGGFQWFNSASPSQQQQQQSNAGFFSTAFCANPTKFNHQKVAADIAAILDENPWLGPTFIRLSWHNSGTFDKSEACPTANTASMRFAPECDHGANAGLGGARDALAKLKKKHPNISSADLWTLAGTVAVAYMGGPTIPWKWGRADAKGPEEASKVADRLPDASQGAAHIRAVFGRMGLTEREAVALIGAHAVGRCHKEASGYGGPWTHSPLLFSNEFFVALLSEKWEREAPVNGGRTKNPQFKDAATGDLMMLPADMAIKDDRFLRKIAQEYADDNDKFCADFSKAWQKLCELNTKNLQECDRIDLE